MSNFFSTFNTFHVSYPYIIVFTMFIVGFYLILVERNLIKKIVGLNLIQGAVVVFYILMAYIDNSLPPIRNINPDVVETYANPLPHVLMLTAIVVGVATTSLACALIYKIYNNYGSVDEGKIMKIAEKELLQKERLLREERGVK